MIYITMPEGLSDEFLAAHSTMYAAHVWLSASPLTPEKCFLIRVREGLSGAENGYMPSEVVAWRQDYFDLIHQTGPEAD